MEAKRSGEISFRSFQLGETKRFVYFFLSIRVSFFLLNDSVSRIKDEPMHFAVSKFFTERPRKNFWQEEQVEFSIKYFRLKHLQFSMQIFSSTRIKLFTQILGKRFNLVSVSAKIYAGDVLDRFNIRTRIPPPVNSRSKEGRRYLAASSVSLRRRGVGRSVCWRNRCRRKRIPDHILPRCVRFSVYVTWSLLSKEVERRTGCEIVSPNRAKKKPSLDNEAHSLSLRYYRIKELDYRREARLTFICIRNEGKFSKNFSSKRNNLIILESD